MKIRITIFTFFISTIFLFSQDKKFDYHDLVRKADSLYWAKDYKNSALTYSMAFKTKGGKALLEDRYKAVCAWTLADIPDSAFFHLDHLIAYAHFSEYDRIVKDNCLLPLHTDKRWKQYLERIEQNILPDGCYRAGSKASSYSMFISHGAGQDGRDVFTIKSNEIEIDGFGTFMQNSLPPEFLGKKIRMTGYMKSENIKDWAGFWLRIDQPNKNAPKQFDNMHDRPVKGTTEWKKYEIVLYVPLKATNISFGGLLHGTGQIWFDKINFEVVDKSVKTTGIGD